MMFSDDEYAGIEGLGRYGETTGFAPQGFAEKSRKGAVEADGFWQSVIAFERAPHTTHFEQLQRKGLVLPEPEGLDDEQLTGKLWEVIQMLADLRVFLKHTDHLSDRELYELLWWDLLRQDTVDTSTLPETRCFLDILGNNETQRYTYLKFYAGETERQFFSEQYPDSDLPMHHDPPFRRDSILPKVG